VYAAEVIRFLHLDFRQHFFDNPGTPFMFLSSAIWALIYSLQSVLNLLPLGMSLEQFTFHHLPALFTMMRGLTLFFYLCSIILLFILAGKLTNKAGASVASLLLLMSPIYSSYSSFARTESLSVCLILIAVLCMLGALENRPRPLAVSHEGFNIILAGIFAGLAAASRLHSITASLPLLLLLLLIRRESPPNYPRWLSLCWNYALQGLFILIITILITIHSGHLRRKSTLTRIIQSYPKTFAALYSYLYVATGAIGAGWILRRLSRTKQAVDRILHPSVFLLLAGCSIGFLVGTPTLLWQYNHFLQSQEWYRSNYFDLERTNWPLLRNVFWYVSFYLRVIAPDYPSLILLFAGTMTILMRRDRVLLPFVIIAALFYVSKPINSIAAPHHVIPWLPFYCIIGGYPVARVFEAMSGRISYERPLKVGVLAAVISVLGLVMTAGPRDANSAARLAEQRMHNILLASNWIKHNTETDAMVVVSYYCFNPDTFFAWAQYLDVPVPKYVFDGRHYIIWWGNRSALKGHSGYGCLSPSDLDAIKIKLDLASPGEGTNPYTDKEFRILKSFGNDGNQVNVFSFDLR